MKTREVQDGTLTLRVAESDSVCRVALGGELDLANAGTLSSELERLEAAGSGTLEIDLSELEFIDSTGIALLVAIYRRLDGSGRLRVVPSRSSGVQRVLALTGLDAELPFASSAGGA